MSIVIAPLAQEEAEAAVALIAEVAQPMFSLHESPADFRARFEAGGYFDDVHHFTTVYDPPDGTFLAAHDGDRLIGIGAIRRFDTTTAELRRLWLREAYHGRGLGYRITRGLLAFARQRGYSTVVLTTDRQQVRAFAFYRQVGFEVMSVAGDDVHMCLDLNSTIALGEESEIA